MVYITKKVHKEIDMVIKFIQAMLQLEKGERIPEAKVIDLALTHYAEEKFGYKKETKHKLDDIINLSKSKVKSSAKDIDKVVYGA
jgi:hypothetical protein